MPSDIDTSNQVTVNSRYTALAMGLGLLLIQITCNYWVSSLLGSGVKASILSYIVGAFIFFSALFLFLKERTIKDFLPEKEYEGSKIITVFVAIIATFILSSMVGAISFGETPETSSHVSPLLVSLTSLSGLWSFAAIILAVVIGPIFEEYIWRGIVMRSLLGYCSPTVAVVASALFFAAWHFDAQGFVGHFVAGVIFGVVCLRTGDLRVAIATHAGNNALGLIAAIVLTQA